jgi:tetratricopeptide (TPR) repeat protein
VASVFLSYDREDLARAKTIASALEKAGHSVWWDRHIRGGSQFSREIEEALKRAEVVVVLWSSRSVESAWVRDEAAAGRDSNRLVPVLIEPVDPPLGFRQYQCVDLIKRRAAGTDELAQAVDALAHERAPTQDSLRPPVRFRSSSSAIWVLGISVIALATIAFLVWRPWAAAGASPVVAVVPVEQTPAARAVSRQLLVLLGTLEAAKTESMTLVESSSGHHDLRLEVGWSDNPEGSQAQLALIEARDSSLLWSGTFNAARGRGADLEQQLAFTAAQVLSCAFEALAEEPRLRHQVVKLYLSACRQLDDLTYGEYRQLIPAFRQVTELAPEFAGGWAKMLQAEALAWLLGPRDKGLGQSLKGDIIKARKVNPHMAEAYLAQAHMTPQWQYAERFRLLDLAIRENPSHPLSFATRSYYLRQIGRMDESVDNAKRAAELDPLSPVRRYDFILALTYAGLFDRARQEINRAALLWPGSSIVAEARYRFNARYGDPKDALQYLNSSGPVSQSRSADAFLRARLRPTPAAIDAAIKEGQREYRSGPEGIFILVETLGEFDREADLKPILLNWAQPEMAGRLAEVLFRPTLEELRYDPLFMRIAQRLQLIRYWRNADKWPDFCSEPQLPYDCRKVAAIYN